MVDLTIDLFLFNLNFCDASLVDAGSNFGEAIRVVTFIIHLIAGNNFDF